MISIEAENAMEDLVLLDCWPLYVPAAGDPAFHLAARVGKPGLLDDIRTMIEQGLITVDLPESDDLNSDSLVRRCRLTTA